MSTKGADVVNGARPDYEAIVVGGGPGGSVTASLLAEAGHRVLLLDKASFPRHKACSEYVNPGGVRVLRDLGLEGDVIAAGAHKMQAMMVHAPGGRRFLADFEGAGPGEYALGLSRHTLDEILLDRARVAGVDVRERAHVRDVLRHDGRVRGVDVSIDGQREKLTAAIVIGADGHHSAVTRSLGLDTPMPLLRRTGLVAHYRGVVGLGERGEMHVAAHGYAGLAPLERGLTNVAFVSASSALSGRDGPLDAYFEEGLARIPAVAERLGGAVRVGGIRGVGPLAHRVTRAAGDGYLLVGDAAAFLDPFTGDGMYEAMRAGQLAAPVASAAIRGRDVSARALRPYRLARWRTFGAKRQVCWIVQGFIHAPILMDYVTDRLDRREELGLTLSGVLGNFRPASAALSPLFLARLLRP